VTRRKSYTRWVSANRSGNVLVSLQCEAVAQVEYRGGTEHPHVVQHKRLRADQLRKSGDAIHPIAANVGVVASAPAREQAVGVAEVMVHADVALRVVAGQPLNEI